MDPATEPTDRLAALLIGLFNIAFAPQHKKMSAKLTERLRTALHDAVRPGDPIYDLLDDLLDELPPAPSRQPDYRPARDYKTMSIEIERRREQRGG